MDYITVNTWKARQTQKSLAKIKRRVIDCLEIISMISIVWVLAVITLSL